MQLLYLVYLQPQLLWQHSLQIQFLKIKYPTIVNIIELQNNRLNNNVIETKPTILLEHKETLPEPEESYFYEEYEITKPKNKDDLVL